MKPIFTLLFLSFFLETATAQNRLTVDSLIGAYRSCHNDSARCRIQFFIADEFYNAKLDTAILLVNQACGLARKTGDCATCQLDCFRGRSFIENRKYNLDKAIAILDTAEILATKTQNWYLLSRIQGQKGGAFNRKKEYERGLAWLKKASGTYESHGCTENSYAIYFNAYVTLSNMGRSEESIDPLKKAYLAAEKWGSVSSQINCLTAIAHQLHSVMKFDESIAYINKALALTQKTGNREKEVMAFYYLARVHNYQGDYPQAISLLKKGFEALGESEDLFLNMTLESNLGLNYAFGGQNEEALPHLEKGLLLSQKAKDVGAKINCTKGLAKVAHNQGRLLEAENLYKKTIEICDSNSIELRISHDAKSALYDFYQKNRMWEKALSAQIALFAARDSLLNRDHLVKVGTLETSLKYEQAKIAQNLEFTKSERAQLTLQAEKLKADYLISAQNNELLKRQLEAEGLSKNILELHAGSERQKLELAAQNAELAKKETENRANAAEIVLNNAELRNQRLMLLIVFGLGLAVLSGLFYSYKKYKRRNALSIRSELAQDLHDDLGSEMSSLSLSAFAAARSGDAQKMAAELQNLSTQSAQMVEEMRDIVWALNPENDATGQLATRMRGFAARIFDEKNVRLKFELSEKIEAVRIEPEARKQIYLIFKEAVTNIAKHAGPTEVFIKMSIENGQFLLEIRDDGRGFDHSFPKETMGGNGLRNLRKRAELLGGQLEIDTSLGGGTVVRLRARLN